MRLFYSNRPTKDKENCKHERMSFGMLHDLCNDCGQIVYSQTHINIQTDEKHKLELQKRRDNFFN